MNTNALVQQQQKLLKDKIRLQETLKLNDNPQVQKQLDETILKLDEIELKISKNLDRNTTAKIKHENIKKAKDTTNKTKSLKQERGGIVSRYLNKETLFGTLPITRKGLSVYMDQMDAEIDFLKSKIEDVANSRWKPQKLIKYEIAQIQKSILKYQEKKDKAQQKLEDKGQSLLEQIKNIGLGGDTVGKSYEELTAEDLDTDETETSKPKVDNEPKPLPENEEVKEPESIEREKKEQKEEKEPKFDKVNTDTATVEDLQQLDEQIYEYVNEKDEGAGERILDLMTKSDVPKVSENNVDNTEELKRLSELNKLIHDELVQIRENQIDEQDTSIDTPKKTSGEPSAIIINKDVEKEEESEGFFAKLLKGLGGIGSLLAGLFGAKLFKDLMSFKKLGIIAGIGKMISSAFKLLFAPILNLLKKIPTVGPMFEKLFPTKVKVDKKTKLDTKPKDKVKTTKPDSKEKKVKTKTESDKKVDKKTKKTQSSNIEKKTSKVEKKAKDIKRPKNSRLKQLKSMIPGLSDKTDVKTKSKVDVKPEVKAQKIEKPKTFLDKVKDTFKSDKKVPNTPKNKITQDIVKHKAKDQTKKTIVKKTREEMTEIALKSAAKSATKKAFILAAVAGTAYAVDRAVDGDYVGAGLELFSGLLGVVPVVGTAGSLMTDAYLLSRDLGISVSEAKDLLLKNGAKQDKTLEQTIQDDDEITELEKETTKYKKEIQAVAKMTNLSEKEKKRQLRELGQKRGLATKKLIQRKQKVQKQYNNGTYKNTPRADLDYNDAFANKKMNKLKRPVNVTIPPVKSVFNPGNETIKETFKLYKKPNIQGLHEGVKHNLKGLGQEYKALTGKTMQVNSAFRSFEEQQKLRDRMGSKAAKPGSSMHNYGLAIDINSRELNEADKLGLLDKYNFKRPVPSEKWHMEPSGINRQKIREEGISQYGAKKVSETQVTPDKQPGQEEAKEADTVIANKVPKEIIVNNKETKLSNTTKIVNNMSRQVQPAPSQQQNLVINNQKPVETASLTSSFSTSTQQG